MCLYNDIMVMRYWPKTLKYLHGNNTINEQKKKI